MNLCRFTQRNHYFILETFFSHENVADLGTIMILTLEYAHEAGKVEIFQYLNKREDLPYDIDPVFEDHADEYFLEHYNQFIEEIIRSHLGDDEHPFPAPPGGDDAVYADGEPDTVSA